MTDFTTLTGCRLPIIQAPMAGVQDSRLAAAVCNAGGLGSLPAAMLAPEQLQQQLDNLTRATSKPFNINFFCHTPPEADPVKEQHWLSLLKPEFERLGLDNTVNTSGPQRQPFSDIQAEILEPYRPAVISFHFGLPSKPLLDRVKSWGSKVISSATTVAEARWLETQGADAVIVQGLEAGGHRGHFLRPDLEEQQSRNTLLQQVKEAVQIPVIAAGGIASAKEVEAVISQGAVAAQVGTSYLLCPEATTSPLHRDALTQARDNPGSRQTVITNLFSGRPARGLVNHLIQKFGPINQEVPDFPLAAVSIAGLRAKAESQGQDDFTPLWSGTNLSGCQDISAAELTQLLASTITRV
ncbi:NAD(P)H-dependent flavin oxidoreductase [Spongorhabdus nitratireducens]